MRKALASLEDYAWTGEKERRNGNIENVVSRVAVYQEYQDIH